MPAEMYVNQDLMVHSTISLFERFTREVLLLIQVEILLILFQGCSHQQGRHLDRRQMQLIDLQVD